MPSDRISMHQDLLSSESKAPHSLAGVIDELAHLLPAQGPISIFIHHNTLHAFEHLPFEEAVELAGERLGCEPFLAESRYRDKLASGRILARDVERLLEEQLREKPGGDVAGVFQRFDLWRAVVLHGIPAATGRELSWLLEETTALSRFRTDLPPNARSSLAVLPDGEDLQDSERRAVRRLWNACLEAVRRAGPPLTTSVPVPVRHRDWLDIISGIDTDARIHPPMIRFLASYLDQGLAHWSMPERGRGIHGCFLEIYRTSLAKQCGPWARSLPRIVADDYDSGRDALRSIENSLAQLGVADDEWADYLTAELLALRGWAGIVHQIEERPDRVPARDLTVTLRGYLAVRLLFERAALEHAAREISFEEPLSTLRSSLRTRLPEAPSPTAVERAWPLFHAAQLCGLAASVVEQWTTANVAEIESELQEIDSIRQRRILHQAFERTVRHRAYDALSHHAPYERVQPAFQAVF